MTKLTSPLLMATLLLGSQAVLAAEPIVIKFSHVVATDTPKGQAAEYFKKLVEERTKGQVKIQIYPNSQLYKDKEELEALQMGSVQMLAPTTSKFGPMGFKEFEVFDMPYVFMNEDQVHKVTRGPVGNSLMQKLESRGIKGLAFWDNGFRVFSANKPLKVPADIKGQKIRINSSKVNQAIIQSVGALPQTMALSEVYQAMQTGVVDGADGNVSNLYTQKQYEVQKYVVDTRHSYSGYAVVVNKPFWDKLPPDIRTTLESAMRDATVYNDQMAEKDTNLAYERIKASGKTQVYVPSAAEKAEWVKAMQPAFNDIAPRIGMATINAVRSAIAK